MLYTEHSVLLVAPDHELAAQGSVSIEVLADHGILRGPPGPDYWGNAFTPFQAPSGRPIERHAPNIASLDDIFTHVSNGDGVHNLGAHVARYNARPDIVYLPIHDWPGLRWALAWREDAETEMVRGLADVVRDLGSVRLS